MKYKKELKIDFWHSSTEQTFLEAKKELIEKGFYSENDANKLLEKLYYATANDYGGE